MMSPEGRPEGGRWERSGSPTGVGSGSHEDSWTFNLRVGRRRVSGGHRGLPRSRCSRVGGRGERDKTEVGTEERGELRWHDL